MNDSVKKIQELLKQSEFLASIKKRKDKKGKSRLFGDDVRLLTAGEIRQLEKQGNHADNWKNVLAVSDFSAAHIYNCRFFGSNVLGVFNGEGNGCSVPTGLYDTTFNESEIGSNCTIHQGGLISCYVIEDGAAILQTRELLCEANCKFGIGEHVRVGNETGGRDLYIFAEMRIEDAYQLATERSNKKFLKAFQDFIKTYEKACTTDFGIVCSNAVLRNCGKIRNTFIGQHAVVDNATLADNCTILSSKKESAQIAHGVILKNSVVQWGAQVTTQAIVECSVLTEFSHVEHHGTVMHSIIGPNTEIGEGEVISSLVGPFVGFHHQALLIAALWPDGKGNVGYGANVGSNHTSKAPDQEIVVGEGVFFGLGVNIKYPSNFKDAPYSIIATGVDTLPQKVQFPFSLINKRTKIESDGNPQINEIFPAWVLADNLYMVYRNEKKFRDRNRARRSSIPFHIFRPEMIDLMIAARCRLDNIKRERSIFTEKEIPGLGKNVMTKHSRKSGIETYSFFIQYYALCGLLDLLESLVKKKEDLTEILYKKKTGNLLWEHQRQVLEEEGLSIYSVEDNLTRLHEMQERIAQKVQRSKEKDDGRGRKIIDDYSQVNTPARDDRLIQQIWKETEELKRRIGKLKSRIQE